MHQDHIGAREEGYVREIADRIIAWVLLAAAPAHVTTFPRRSACSRPGPRVPLTGRRRLPPAPAPILDDKCWLKTAPRLSENSRAMTSAAPARREWTTTRTGRSGHSPAAAAVRETMANQDSCCANTTTIGQSSASVAQADNRPSAPSRALLELYGSSTPLLVCGMIPSQGGADSFGIMP